MLAHLFDRFYIVAKFMLPSMGDLKFSNLNFDHSCTYMNKKYTPNMDSSKYPTELKTYCNKIKPFVSHYSKLIKSYNTTVYNILTKEIRPLLPCISKQKCGIVTTLVSCFIGLAFEGISSFLLIRCMPWTTKLCPHPYIIKKMKTFLEVENKMGPIIPALVSQFRPPLPETNPRNIKKGDSMEKRRALIKKRFRPATPKATVVGPPLSQTVATPRATMMHLPFPQTAPKPTNGADDTVTVREDTPWHSTGKRSWNLFEERNWVLPKDYSAIEGKKEDAMAKPPPKEEPKMGEQTSNQKEEKCGWGPNCPFCKAQKEDVDPPHLQEQIEDQQQKPLPKQQAKRPETLNITKTRQQWEVEMESLNAKYNLGSFSNSELNSESDEDE